MFKKTVPFLLSACFILSSCNGGSKHVTDLADLSRLGKNEPVIVRNEKYSKWNRGTLDIVPSLNNSTIDVRSYDISKVDLESYKDDLEYINFDEDTIWPDTLPAGFNPQEIMELGKNPGLGVQSLHEQGITGKGVSIAIIDQGLLLEHEEYKDNIMMYELLHCSDESAQMHGPAVTSIAVGKSVGVAPDAKVYYIASTFGTFANGGFDTDLTIMADGIKRVLQINDSLPENDKIRVVSISRGFDEETKGAQEVVDAIELAKEAGVFVVTTSTDKNYDLFLMGLDRELNGNPDDVNSYAPGLFWEGSYYNEAYFQNRKLMLVPMDSRSYASFTGVSDYAFRRSGGLSWTCPWLAGMYALCVQVKPNVTPDVFIRLAYETGDTIELNHEGTDYSFGTIINPTRMIKELANK